MNKVAVNTYIDFAYQALKEEGIAKNNEINRAFRGQISSFGSAISTGSLVAAIAYFSDDGGSSVSRKKLISAIYNVLKKAEIIDSKQTNLIDFAKNNKEAKEHIINASIAIKLSMNLYELVDEKK